MMSAVALAVVMIVSAAAFCVLFRPVADQTLLELTGGIQIVHRHQQPFAAVPFDSDLVHAEPVLFQRQHGAFSQVRIIFVCKEICFRDLLGDLDVIPILFANFQQSPLKIPHILLFGFFTALFPADGEREHALFPVLHGDQNGIALIELIIPVEIAHVEGGQSHICHHEIPGTEKGKAVFFALGGEIIDHAGISQHHVRRSDLGEAGGHGKRIEFFAFTGLQNKFICKDFIAVAEGHERSAGQQHCLFDLERGRHDPEFRSPEKFLFRIGFAIGIEEIVLRSKDQFRFLLNPFAIGVGGGFQRGDGGFGQFGNGEGKQPAEAVGEHIFHGLFNTVQAQHISSISG